MSKILGSLQTLSDTQFWIWNWWGGACFHVSTQNQHPRNSRWSYYRMDEGFILCLLFPWDTWQFAELLFHDIILGLHWIWCIDGQWMWCLVLMKLRCNSRFQLPGDMTICVVWGASVPSDWCRILSEAVKCLFDSSSRPHIWMTLSMSPVCFNVIVFSSWLKDLVWWAK